MLLEQATNIEVKQFLALVASLENDELYMFVHAVSELEPIDDADKINDIIHIARNVKRIDDALDNFYVA
jgi:hypothetical protein